MPFRLYKSGGRFHLLEERLAQRFEDEQCVQITTIDPRSQGRIGQLQLGATFSNLCGGNTTGLNDKIKPKRAINIKGHFGIFTR